jgi:heme a synthase
MNTAFERPIARIVQILGVVMVLFAAVLLTLGGLTTSFRAGMADPVWPTEPWFLAVNGTEYFHEKYTGFLLEHTHRLAGWTVGGWASLLAFTAWFVGPDRRRRLFGLGCVVILLVTYGWLHGQMMAAQKNRVITGEFIVPFSSAIASAASVILLLLACIQHLLTNQSGKVVRVATAMLLIAVMIQGLLGGFRVFLDQSIGVTRTLGIELSATHGLFAQLVFSLILCVPILASTRRPADTLCADSYSRLRWLGLMLPLAVFVQLIWAVWVRHAPTPLMQRLHILTAFIVVGLVVWLTVRVRSVTDAARLLLAPLTLLLLLLTAQVVLGLEAWMGKFAAAGEYGLLPPDQRPVTVWSGTLRTLHQLIGTAILATSVVVALRVWRRPVQVGAGTKPRTTQATFDAVAVAMS